MSDPKKQTDQAAVDSLHAYYTYASQQEGYEGSFDQMYVEGMAEILNQRDVERWIQENNSDTEETEQQRK